MFVAHPTDDLERVLLSYLEETASGPERKTFEICFKERVYRISIYPIPSVVAESRMALSPREQQISQLISLGLTNKAIASKLKLRPCTVNTYIKRIYLKLNVNSRTEMVTKVFIMNTHLDVV
jgi:DNA-binding NarL/FixJ family response regulator